MKHVKPFRITLLHKALALVFIPFVFNCVWLISLSNMLNQAKRLAEMERQRSQFIEGLNSVLKDSYQTRENFVGFIATNSGQYMRKADLWIGKTKGALVQLRSLPELTTDQLQLVDELEEILLDQFQRIRDVLNDSTGDSKRGLLEDVEPVSDNIEGVLNKYPNTEAHLAKQRSDLDAARAEAKRSSALAQQTVMLGLTGNLVLALFLAFAIRQDLAKRLARLMDNTQKLSRSEELNSHISGSDELTDLDRSLHDASAKLLKAIEFRSSVTQMVAHDLRSPLTSCMIGIDVLQEVKLEDRERRNVDAIRANLDRVINLTNDLLLIEQFENAQLSLSLEPENIHELIEQACASLESQSKARRITISNQADFEYLVVDRKRIVQVLVNYLSNALKFSATDSTITITTLKPGKNLKVLVHDSGPGVHVDEQEKIFENFFQTKEGKSAGGTGLGLAISKLIIEAHGGSVGVTSHGHGAVFWFSIPLLDSDSILDSDEDVH